MSHAGTSPQNRTGRARFDRDARAVQEHDAPGVDDALITLAPDADAPSAARAFVREHREHLGEERHDDAVLVVSELVTNAVQHGRPVIALRVRSVPAGIGIAVADDGPPIPEVDAHDPSVPRAGATSGRGMAIVAAVADAWGIEPHVPLPGKTVWCELGDVSVSANTTP